MPARPIALPAFPAALFSALVLGIALAAAAAAKDSHDVPAIGPPAPLSSGQRAALAAKRLSLPTAAAAPALPAPAAQAAKAPPVVTVGAAGAAMRRDSPPAPVPVFGRSRRPAVVGAAHPRSEFGVHPWSPATTRSAAPCAIDELRASLGPERSIAAGLVKTGDRIQSGGVTRPLPKEERP